MTPSTLARYSPDSGPIIFGQGPISIRRRPGLLIIEAGDGAWTEVGERADHLLIVLYKAHKEGRLAAAVKDYLRPYTLAATEWYRVGDLLCYRPEWQSAHA